MKLWNVELVISDKMTSSSEFYSIPMVSSVCYHKHDTTPQTIHTGLSKVVELCNYLCSGEHHSSAVSTRFLRPSLKSEQLSCGFWFLVSIKWIPTHLWWASKVLVKKPPWKSEMKEERTVEELRKHWYEYLFEAPTPEFLLLIHFPLFEV